MKIILLRSSHKPDTLKGTVLLQPPVIHHIKQMHLDSASSSYKFDVFHMVSSSPKSGVDSFIFSSPEPDVFFVVVRHVYLMGFLLSSEHLKEFTEMTVTTDIDKEKQREI